MRQSKYDAQEERAIDAFEEALIAFPNDHKTMLRMEQVRKLEAV
jgi:hypothetical protein